MMARQLSAVLVSLYALCAAGCREASSTVEGTMTAMAVIDSARAYAGVSVLEDATVSFRFRKAEYVYRHQPDGRFSYTRRRLDSTGVDLVDVLTNDTLVHTRAGTLSQLSPKQAAAYSESINSVMYFAFLPLALRDEAVQARYEQLDTIAESAYHRVHVSFAEAGGGTDFEDEFLYWFAEDTYALDYLAYVYATDGGGVRFRAAYNARTIEGIRLVDYRNYQPNPAGSVDLSDMASAYHQGELELLSLIELEDVRVERPSVSIH